MPPSHPFPSLEAADAAGSLGPTIKNMNATKLTPKNAASADWPAPGFFFLFILCLEDPALFYLLHLWYFRVRFLFGRNFILVSSAVFQQHQNVPPPCPRLCRWPRGKFLKETQYLVGKWTYLPMAFKGAIVLEKLVTCSLKKKKKKRLTKNQV